VPDFIVVTKRAYHTPLAFMIVLDKWLPPIAVAFAVALVVMTELLAYHNHGMYISGMFPTTPFGAWRVQYDIPLSMAPVIMMFMVPEPRFRSEYYYWESYYPNKSPY
jgi:hypothetical protein